jgi:dimethylargininase
MKIAVTRRLSPAINRCELSHLERVPIDFARASIQHRAYVACLRELGLRVVELAAEPELPDSVFVEDPAVVVDELAVIARMGAASRRAEAESLAQELARYRPLHWMQEPATLEGGDVLRIGRTLYVGLSARTNAAGVEELRKTLGPLGYSVIAVPMADCLHLKSACCVAGETKGERVLLANPEWVDPGIFPDCRVLEVSPDEPRAANVLAPEGSGAVVIASCFPKTARKLASLGLGVRTVDISELMKAESGLTCSSQIFEETPTLRPAGS